MNFKFLVFKSIKLLKVINIFLSVESLPKTEQYSKLFKNSENTKFINEY